MFKLPFGEETGPKAGFGTFLRSLSQRADLEWISLLFFSARNLCKGVIISIGSHTARMKAHNSLWRYIATWS
ncbi:Hat family dimerization protein [Fusarium oxysporum f. sp. albedinis]|nr:Hat family dimerization protein [Fusarium oxysporum f. sp. albedinis]